jgi:hypothetical protein
MKGEIMASLADRRFRSLHEEFREGARCYPDLLFAALTPLHPEETAWPEVPIRSASELGPQFFIAVPDHPEGMRWNGWEIRDSSEVLSQSPLPESLLAQYRSIGFTGGTFCDLLGNLPCEYRLVPIVVCWLQIEGRLWEGVFYDGDVRKYASRSRDEEAVERRREYCLAGVDRFTQLARRCALQFSLLYEPDAKVVASCRREHVPLVWETLVKRESRWLENLCNMPFVQADTVVRPWGQYRLRHFPGDVFTASAMAMESLLSGSAIGSPLAACSRNTPVVFISSTKEDLVEYRAKARDAVNHVGFVPRMQEYFASSGNPPLTTCLEKVSGSTTEVPADVLVVIVAHRCGWIPENQPGPDYKSITWLECEEARKNGKEVLAFIVEEKHSWPAHWIDKDQSDVDCLNRFKKWINSCIHRKTFTTPDSLFGKVLAALHDWEKRRGDAGFSRP